MCSINSLLVARKGLYNNFSHDFVRQAVEKLYIGNGRRLEDLWSGGSARELDAAK